MDHLVLTVADIDKTIEFYTQIMGFEAATFGDNRKALTFGSQKINLHQKGNEFEPKAQFPTCVCGSLFYRSNRYS
ncbi:VOC family protein [Chryseobacterium sp. NRRL B-14859]|uniref:VOC family protein n=1 Tax=Chryseobacterium sp. NRRL B-14859 TaxID=1562763 RepID=UPI00339A00F8